MRMFHGDPATPKARDNTITNSSGSKSESDLGDDLSNANAAEEQIPMTGSRYERRRMRPKGQIRIHLVYA